MNFIEGERLVFRYNENGRAVDETDINIEQGSFTAIIGHNGSGKSTLAKMMNGLLIPNEGSLYVDGKITGDENNLWEIRKSAGMVFQNPDDQIVTSIVEQDVAFGVENLGIEPSEIEKRIETALEKVNMTKFRKSNVSKLSGGQKQKVAIAGVLAMRGKCIIFDEPSAMLDPVSRKELTNTIIRLKEDGVTVVLITHYMEEALYADKVIIMDKGKVTAEGEPAEIFGMYDMLSRLKLGIPPLTEIAFELEKKGFDIKKGLKSCDEMMSCLKDIGITDINPNIEPAKKRTFSENIIEVRNLTYIYGNTKALDNVSFDIPKGSFTAIIGHTGSGKSTLSQNLNGLEAPSEGKVYFKGKDINSDRKKLSEIRKKIGLVFQYPETQLFETTVFKDVAFAPSKMGLSEEEIKERVKEALDMVEIDESFYEKMPMSLSGGQKRRVATAGILAMKPEVLILDEPTAGLDNSARLLMLESIKRLNRIKGITIIFITHNMADIAELADNVIVMRGGKISRQGSPSEVFSEGIEESGIIVPETVRLMTELKKINPYVPTDVFNPVRAGEIIGKILKKG